MKFLVSWRLHEEKRHDTLKAFAQMTEADDQAGLGSVQLIGRWQSQVRLAQLRKLLGVRRPCRRPVTRKPASFLGVTSTQAGACLPAETAHRT